MRESLGVTKPGGAVKAKDGPRGRLGWDPPSSVAGAHHRPVSAAASARRSESVHVGTRKMVNYA